MKPTIDNSYALLAQSRGAVVPLTWRPSSIPNTAIYIYFEVWYTSLFGNCLRTASLPCGAGKLSHSCVAGRYLEVAAAAAALIRVRNNPHPPTRPPKHPPTNPSTHQTPQPPYMCYSCTAVRIAADSCGLGSANRKRMSSWCGCCSVCNPFSSPRCRSFSDTEGFLDRGWGYILPGLHSLYTPQPISDRPVG